MWLVAPQIPSSIREFIKGGAIIDHETPRERRGVAVEK